MKTLVVSLTVPGSGMQVCTFKMKSRYTSVWEFTLGGRATFYQTNADLSIRDPAFDVFNVLDNSFHRKCWDGCRFNRFTELC